MKCVNCGHEQESGKFCGKCGTTMEITSNPAAEAGQRATVDSAPQQPTPPAPPAQPNEQIERVKKTSELYISYVKEFIRQPSRIFQVTDQQYVNAIITIAIILLLASYTVFLAVKTFYKNTIGKASGLVDLIGGDIGSAMLPKMEFFPVFSKAFMFFLVLLAISVGISFAVTKLSKQQLNFKQLISIYGTLLLPVVGIVLLAFLSVLINKLIFGLAVLVFGFAIAVYVYPLRLVFTNFGGASKLDASHKGLIYFVGFTFVCYVIASQYVKDVIDQIKSLIDLLKML